MKACPAIIAALPREVKQLVRGWQEHRLPGKVIVYTNDLAVVSCAGMGPARAALAVQAAMSIGLVLASSILVRNFHSFKSTTAFDVLTNYVIFASSIFYMLAVLGVVILRRKYPDLPRPYRTLGYPVVPFAYAAFYAWFLGEVYLGDPAQANIGLGLIALGIPVYFGWQRWQGTRERDELPGES